MALVSKPYTFSSGAIIIASEHNANFDTLYNDYNGNITNFNIDTNAAIEESKLDLSEISQAIDFLGAVDFSSATVTGLDTSEVTSDTIFLDETTAPTTAAGQGALYTKDTSGQPELFFREESSGDEIQITDGGSLNTEAINGAGVCSFLVRATGSGTFDETGGYDVGSNFASNTFTAPVDGKYLMTYSMRFASNTNNIYCTSVTITPSVGSAAKAYNTWYTSSPTTRYTTVTATQIFNLSANDTVTASYVVNETGSGASATATTNNIIYSYWSGSLLA